MPSILSDEMKARVKEALKKLSDMIKKKRDEFQKAKGESAREAVRNQLNELKAKYNKFYAQLNGHTHYMNVATASKKSKPTVKAKMKISTAKVIISESAANAFLMADGMVNFDKVKALNTKTSQYETDTAAGTKISGYYTMPRKAKPARHSAAKHKAVDVKYLGQRAIKVSFKKRLTEAGLVRNVALLTVVEGTGVPAALKAQIKSAVSALNSHMKKTETVKTKVTAKKSKLRIAADKVFDSALTDFRKILTTAGVKDTDMVESKGMMGRTVLLKVGKDTVVSIGRADMARFRAAVKASKEVSTSTDSGKKVELTSESASMTEFKKAVKELWPGAHAHSKTEGVGYFAELHGGMDKACKNLESKGYVAKSSKGVNEFVYERDGLELCVSEDEGKTIVYLKEEAKA